MVARLAEKADTAINMEDIHVIIVHMDNFNTKQQSKVATYARWAPAQESAAEEAPVARAHRGHTRI